MEPPGFHNALAVQRRITRKVVKTLEFPIIPVVSQGTTRTESVPYMQISVRGNEDDDEMLVIYNSTPIDRSAEEIK